MSASCPTARSGVHSMYGEEITEDMDEDDIYRPTICTDCGEICFFNFDTAWWMTYPYTIEEEPA